MNAGTIKINDQDFSFREYVGTVNSEVQLIRIYDVASNPSGANLTIHRADLIHGVPSQENRHPHFLCIQIRPVRPAEEVI